MSWRFSQFAGAVFQSASGMKVICAEDAPSCCVAASRPFSNFGLCTSGANNLGPVAGVNGTEVWSLG